MDKNVVDYSYLLDEFGEDKIQGRCNWLYFFKYRHVTPQFIELMLISFNAGRGYQHSVDYQN